LLVNERHLCERSFIATWGDRLRSLSRHEPPGFGVIANCVPVQGHKPADDQAPIATIRSAMRRAGGFIGVQCNPAHVEQGRPVYPPFGLAYSNRPNLAALDSP
jgi:hypothetical protein